MFFYDFGLDTSSWNRTSHTEGTEELSNPLSHYFTAIKTWQIGGKEVLYLNSKHFFKQTGGETQWLLIDFWRYELKKTGKATFLLPGWSNNSGFPVPASLLSISNTQSSTKTKGTSQSLSLEEPVYTWKGFCCLHLLLAVLWSAALPHGRFTVTLEVCRSLLVISGFRSEDSFNNGFNTPKTKY